MLEQFVQIKMLLASLRDNIISVSRQNEALTKLYAEVKEENELLKRENDEYKRNIEKTSQEVSTSESGGTI